MSSGGKKLRVVNTKNFTIINKKIKGTYLPRPWKIGTSDFMKILVLGSKGMLGAQLMRVFGNDAVGWDRNDCDVTNTEDLKFKIKELKPAVIINCVAYNNVDGAEENKDAAFKLNAELPKNLAEISKELNIILVHFSTNHVFDGIEGEYEESALPNPISVYAKSKLKGEWEIQQGTDKFYLIRTAVIFGPKGESELSKKSFVDIMLDLSQKTQDVKAVSDEINSTTYAVDLAGQIKLLLTEGAPYGIYHITNTGFGSWYDFAKEIFKILGKQINLIPVLSEEFPRAAVRPKKAVLINTKLPDLRPWQEALSDFLTPKI